MRGNHAMHALCAPYGNTTLAYMTSRPSGSWRSSTMKNSLGALLEGFFVTIIRLVRCSFGIRLRPGANYAPEGAIPSSCSPPGENQEVRTLKKVSSLILLTRITLYDPENRDRLWTAADGIVRNHPDLFEVEDRYIDLNDQYQKLSANEPIALQMRRNTEIDMHEQEIVARRLKSLNDEVQRVRAELESRHDRMKSALEAAAKNLQAEECKRILNGTLGIERRKMPTRHEASYEKRSDGTLWETGNIPWTVVTRYIFELTNPDTRNPESVWLLLVTHTPIETIKANYLVPVRRNAGHMTVVSDREVLRPTGKFGPETVQFCATSVNQMDNDELGTIALFKRGRKKNKRS